MPTSIPRNNVFDTLVSVWRIGRFGLYDLSVVEWDFPEHSNYDDAEKEWKVRV